MINSREFTKRLKEIFEYYELSASSFADKIDVGRASISHILSGRNKPSLDFVMRVVSTFEEVELYWLLNGKGDFPPLPETSKVFENDKTSIEKNLESPKDLFSSEQVQDNSQASPKLNTPPNHNKIISKVIIFYSDGSFESYENSPKT